MKKVIKFILTFIFILVFGLTIPALSPAATKIKLAHDMSTDINHPTHAFAVVFKNYIETQTEERYAVEIFPSSVLGKERERLELTRANGIQVNLASLGGASVFYKPILLLNTPFMYSSDRIVHAVFESEFTKDLLEDMKVKTGLQPILIYDLGGLSCLTNNVRPIRTPADMKGIKFRAMDDSQIVMFRALGANAVPIAWAEVYTALQTGVVDGQVNPISIIVDAKLYEVQKYLTLSRTILGSHLVVVNNQWYGELPPDIRRIVDDAFHYANLAAKGLSQVSQATGLKLLKEHGMEVIPLTEEAYKEFKKIGCNAVLEWFKGQIDPQWVDAFVATVEEIEKTLLVGEK